MPIFSILWDMTIQNIHNLEFDLSRLPKVEVNVAIRKPTYDFLLVNYGKYMLICSILGDIATQNMCDLEFAI